MSTEAGWETELADYLNDLSSGQDELLDVLRRKLRLLATADREGLHAIGEVEQCVGVLAGMLSASSANSSGHSASAYLPIVCRHSPEHCRESNAGNSKCALLKPPAKHGCCSIKV